MSAPLLLAVGGAHVDRRGRIAGPHMPEASNPGAMREEVGGGAFNAARAAVQRGVRTAFVSLRGGDMAGEMVAEAIEAAGMADLSGIFLDRRTPSYTAVLTEAGDLVTALADMELYEHGFRRHLRRRSIEEAAGRADAVLCDANMPAEAVARLAALSAGKPLFAIAVSPAKAPRLLPSLGSLSCLFMNRREACRLAGTPAEATPAEAARALLAAGLQAGVITAGGRPALGFSRGLMFEIAPPPALVADVTGAGDALAGATAAGLMRGLAFAQAVREGMAAAKLAVESDAAAPEMGEAAFGEALALVPRPKEIT